MRELYNGPILPGRPIAIEDDPKERFFGWLLAKGPDGQWVTIAQLPKLPTGPNELSSTLLAAIYKGYLKAIFYLRLPHGETIGDILFREDYKLHDAILGAIREPI